MLNSAARIRHFPIPWRRWPGRTAAVDAPCTRGLGSFAAVHRSDRSCSFAAVAVPFPQIPLSMIGCVGPRCMSGALEVGAAMWGGKHQTASVARPTVLQTRAMSSQRRGRGVDMTSFGSLGEMISVVHKKMGSLSDRDISAFWTEVSKSLQRRNSGSLDDNPNAAKQLDDILCHTLEGIMTYTESLSPRDLAQTAISLAKIMKMIEDRRGRLRKGSPHQILHDVLIGHNSQNKQFIWRELAAAAMPMREEFEPRELSNLVYAFGLSEHVLKFDDGRTLFDVLAHVASSQLEKFNGQDISNMLWAYGNVKVSNSRLFKEVGDNIASRESLESFWPQHLANIAWAYATLDESHPTLFTKVADHIVALDSLHPFKPQELSNIVWAFASAKEAHPALFRRVADHIVSLDSLDAFNPQNFANTLWAYANAREPHPKLFKKLGDHFDMLHSLESFSGQDLSNTVWAYATAKEAHPVLFKKVAEAAIEKRSEVIPQEVANLLWAYATNGQIDQRLFKAFAPTAAALLGKCNEQGLANIAWAYAVADVAAPSLFNEDFINACQEKEGTFTVENLCQLHQWNLWQEEVISNVRLPPALQQKCHNAFVSSSISPSGLQDDVIAVLSIMSLQPKEEVLTEKGYSLDALVEVEGSKIGVEVDGPFHFVGRKPNGSTILKRRQVPNLEGIPFVSVPYWEWDKLGKTGKNREKKEHYLRALLGTS